MTDYLTRNQEHWAEHAHSADKARRQWEAEPAWGIWGIPEAEVGFLPDVEDRDVLENGCGTAYVSHWLARKNARPVGLDPTVAQLDTARQMQAEFDVRFPLIRGVGEDLPFPDDSFDVVVSEYGASIWADPYKWVPEAARVLRPGGELSFLCNANVLVLCMPSSDDDLPVKPELVQDFFGMHRFDWEDGSVNFYLGHGDWIRLLRTNGFEILDMIELRAPKDSTNPYGLVTSEWAQRWPSEEVWRGRYLGPNET